MHPHRGRPGMGAALGLPDQICVRSGEIGRRADRRLPAQPGRGKNNGRRAARRGRGIGRRTSHGSDADPKTPCSLRSDSALRLWAARALPVPLPGVRLGLANVITLYLLLTDTPGSAAAVLAARVALAALLFGSATTFSTPRRAACSPLPPCSCCAGPIPPACRRRG